MARKRLRVFVSYAWEDEAHKHWVQRLAARLRYDGIDARLDAWDRKEGQSLQGFMTSEVEDADKVLIVCSPGYKRRVQAMDRGQSVSGVGLEWCVLSTEMFQSGVMGKPVAVIARGTMVDAVPTIMQSVPVFNLTGDETLRSEYDSLFESLTGQRPKGPYVAKDVRRIRHPLVKPLLPETGPMPRHNLPFPRNDRFVGRDEELDALHKALDPNTPVAITQPTWSLTGMGGTGKTQVAVEYTYRHLGDYEKVLWVNAEGDDIATDIAALAPILGLELPEEMPVPQKATQVRLALESGQRYLLILDNVEKPGVCEHLRPRDGQTRVLITTRRRDLGFRQIDVNVLPEDRALELLLGARTVGSRDLSDALALCTELGFLTLAIDVASRILSLGVRTVPDLLASVRESGPVSWSDDADADNLFHKRPQLGHLFETSYALLREDVPRDVLARHMLLSSGWFAPVGIPREILGAAARRYATKGGSSANEDSNLEHRAMERLAALGLAVTEEGDKISFHRVVRDFARRKGGFTYRRPVHDTLAEIANATEGDALRLLSLIALRAHLEMLMSDLSSSSRPNHMETAARMAQHYWHCGQYRGALGAAERGLTLAREETLIAWLLAERGDAFRSLGDYDQAIETLRRSLEITEKVLGEEHPSTASTLNAIGQTLHAQGKYDEALSYYRRDLEITEKVLGEEHPSTAITLNAIGQTLHAQGKYDEALSYYRRSLEIKEKVLGEEHPETAITRFELGRALLETGDAKGEQYMRAAAQVLEEHLGREHPMVRDARSWLNDE